MSRADVQQFSRPRGFETLGDWQGPPSEVSEPVEVMVRLPDMTASPTRCTGPRAQGAAADACVRKDSQDKPDSAAAATSCWGADGNGTPWSAKLRPWGQMAQATAAAAVLLLIVIALLLIRGRDGGESYEVAAPSPQDVEHRLVDLPDPAGDRSLGNRDLPVVPLLPPSAIPFERSSHERPQTDPSDAPPGSASASDLATGSSDGETDGGTADDGDGGAVGGASSEASSPEEPGRDDSRDEQPPRSSEDAEHRHSAPAAPTAEPSQGTPKEESSEVASEREVSGVPLAERSAEGKQGEASGAAGAEEADEPPPVEASELVQGVTRPSAPSEETQFTQHPGAVGGPSRGAESPVVRRSYPVTNPASYQYPSDYHRLFFFSSPDPADATGVPSRETHSIYETPSDTARLQPQIEPPPRR